MNNNNLMGDRQDEQINKNGLLVRDGHGTDDIDFDFDNADIQSTYKTGVNFRIGGEYRYELFRFRLGYNLMADAYAESDGVKRNINAYSGGAGIKTKHFFTDLAVVYRTQSATRIPYSVPDFPTPVANLNVNTTNFILTVGATF